MDNFKTKRDFAEIRAKLIGSGGIIPIYNHIPFYYLFKSFTMWMTSHFFCHNFWLHIILQNYIASVFLDMKSKYSIKLEFTINSWPKTVIKFNILHSLKTEPNNH